MPPRSLESNLPPPDAASLERSRGLEARIRAEIDAAGGWIGFERYVELALYAPGLGYYHSEGEKLGPGGDFVTAPELSDALARAIVAASAPWLGALKAPSILELGAGRGTLAAQILDALDGLGLSHVPYRILETSGTLRQRQAAVLAARAGRVEWLDRLPEAFDGLIVANEVADALPFERFVRREHGARPLGVAAGERLGWAEGPPQPALADAVAALEARLGAPLPAGYRSELRRMLPAWVGTLGACLGRGALLLVDYGYERRDYYRPERADGTLMCHYRHRAHGDPFVYPGLQDITAWVDFSAAADAAAAAGFDVAGYTTQAQFLIGALGDALVRDPGRASPAALGALKTLLMPGEMGERFKVFLAAKGQPGVGLPGRDFRARL